MKVLLSAYACEPNKGSEPGVGWNWATEIAVRHETWVLTKANNRDTIEPYLAAHPEMANDRLHFVYVDLSPKLTIWKKGLRGVRLYYWIWQIKAVRVARELHREVGFDLVHHVSFVSYTQPTYLHRLGIPFLWGPVAGGENIPGPLRRTLNRKDACTEWIRRLSQYLTLCTPWFLAAAGKAYHIFVTTPETAAFFPGKYQPKISVLQAIGVNGMYAARKRPDEPANILMAGDFTYIKAMQIGIEAFKRIADAYGNANLYLIGRGNKERALKESCGKLLGHRIFFPGRLSQGGLNEMYAKSHIFLNTSLRDSGCMVVLEAMSCGLPVVCLDTGGPKLNTTSGSAIKISPNGIEQVVADIAEGLSRLLGDKELRERMGERAIREIEGKFLPAAKWKAIEPLYQEIEEKLYEKAVYRDAMLKC